MLKTQRSLLCHFLLIFLLSLLPLLAYSWGSQGHLVIAEIAYNHLTDKAKKEVSSLMSLLSKKKAKAAFIDSSTWADDIRYQKITTYNAWHYIHLPYVLDKVTLPILSTPNISTASKSQLHILKDTHSTLYQKAFSLRLLIHLMGDLHQPLHVITRYDHHFKRGDLNGLKYEIKSRYKNLHRFWDAGGGILIFRKNKNKRREKLTKQIEKKYRFIPEVPVSNYEDKIDVWINDSFNIAKEKAYLQKRNHKITKKYRKTVRDTTQSQLFKAGKNLANVLNQIYH